MIKKLNILEYRKLKDISFECDKKINVISGANGTCKSSILHIISNSFQKIGNKNNYIKDKKMGYFEVSKNPDGWYSCLHFVDIYSIYDVNVFKENYLKIIHQAIFARVLDIEYIGNWNLLLGNIPKFIAKYNIDINWDKMYIIFKWFLKESLICD